MSFLEWDESLDVHVDAINHQHKGLIDRMNRLHELVEQGANRALIGAQLVGLGQATTTHFAQEEQYMASIGYPKLSQHKIIHTKLLKKFGDHVAEFEAGKELGQPFFYFLKVWLQSHIRGIDVQYSEFSLSQSA